MARGRNVLHRNDIVRNMRHKYRGCFPDIDVYYIRTGYDREPPYKRLWVMSLTGAIS